MSEFEVVDWIFSLLPFSASYTVRPLMPRGSPSPLDFEYRWNVVKSGHFQWDRDLRVSTKRWIAHQISIDGEGAYWVMDPRGLIKKDNLIFAANVI